MDHSRNAKLFHPGLFPNSVAPVVNRHLLLRLLIYGLNINIIPIINEGLGLAGFVGLSSQEIDQHYLIEDQNNTRTMKRFHKPQKVDWGPRTGRPAGIQCTDATTDEITEFVPWREVKKEIEGRLLNQLGLHVAANCTVALDGYQGRENWLVRIVTPGKQNIGYVWFGTDPDEKWRRDGLVRVGDNKCVVWQVFQRCSDGTYDRVRIQQNFTTLPNQEQCT